VGKENISQGGTHKPPTREVLGDFEGVIKKEAIGASVGLRGGKHNHGGLVKVSLSSKVSIRSGGSRFCWRTKKKRTEGTNWGEESLENALRSDSGTSRMRGVCKNSRGFMKSWEDHLRGRSKNSSRGGRKDPPQFSQRKRSVPNSRDSHKIRRIVTGTPMELKGGGKTTWGSTWKERLKGF